MADELEKLKAELTALHAVMSLRIPSSYTFGEIERLREQQRDLQKRIEALEKAKPRP